MLNLARIYDGNQPDGYRVLVDRIWPRGMSKVRAKLDLWEKDVAPSTELRKWFGHDPQKFAEFKERYTAELNASGAASALFDKIKDQPNVLLLYAAKDVENNNAVVLQEILNEMNKNK